MKIFFCFIIIFFANSFFVDSIGQADSIISYNADFSTNYKNISTEINSIISKYKLTNSRYSIAIYSTKMNKYLYTYNPQMLLVPASNTKLITTFTTYNLLQSDKTIKTKIAIDGEIIDGVLNGNLYIIGGGDALLSIHDLEIIADEIRRYGINKINGNVIGDDTFFDNIYSRFNYSGDKDVVEQTANVSALSLEKNVVNVIVTSGSAVGKSVNVSFKPASSSFVVSNSAKVSASVQPTSKQQKGKKKNTPKNPITISSNLDSLGCQVFYIKGSLSPNKTYTYRVFIQNPALATASALKDRLISGSVSVSGNAIKKQTTTENTDIKIIYTFYRDANEIINTTNKKSDNYLSENLFKLNGAIFDKDKNTAKSASTANLQILNDNEIDTKGFVFNDGSGLSRRNLITTEGLTNLIIKAIESPFANDFINSLSIAGYDGTLLKRMQNTFAEGNVRAKTGTLSNVSSLSGIINNRSADTIVFAFIFNGGSVGTYKKIENEISILLSGK
ncbi:MAG: D-alanyl-D-alanine carboxypeptidase/D-alanyl-D-alanine-endopeptidase [Bacteroidetes bacterium]|nr:D-alanyl-D-alanine carboxypeptidase/D-alanyl-D-alanine-endopeptidase [Bacteroidota bacterium]